MAGRYPHELSGGQKQRGSIARALLANPRIVLLDEPGRGLDAALRIDLYTLIRELKDGLRVPVLLVTHDPAEECFALAERVLIYRGEGRIVHRGTPAELLRNPGNRGGGAAFWAGSRSTMPEVDRGLDPRPRRPAGFA